MNRFTPFRPEEVPTHIQKTNGKFAWEFYSLIEQDGATLSKKETPVQVADSKWYEIPHAAAFIALAWERPPFVSETALGLLDRSDSVGGDTFRIKDVLQQQGFVWDRFSKTWIKR